MQSEYDSSNAKLKDEKKRREKAEDKIADLTADVKDAWAQLENNVANVGQEREELERMKAEMESVKRQYYLVSDKVEEEQGRLMEAQKLTAKLSDQITDLTKARDRAERRASDLSDRLDKAKKEASDAKKTLKKEAKEKSVAMKERTKLESELAALKSEAEEARTAMEEAKAKLETETAARVDAEQTVAQLK